MGVRCVGLVCALMAGSMAGGAVAQMPVGTSAAAGAASARAAAAKKEKAKKASIAEANAKADQEDAEEAAKPVPPDPAATLAVHDGDPVQLRVVKEVSSKTAKQGDPVMLELAEDIKVGDVVVARAGSRAMGEVIWVEKAGFLGKGGDLEVRLDYLKIGERKLRLRGTNTQEAGAGRQAGAAILTVTIGVGLFIRGKDMVLGQGSVIKAYLGDDAMLAPA